MFSVACVFCGLCFSVFLCFPVFFRGPVFFCGLESLSNAEVETVRSRLRLSVDEEPGNRIQLKADISTNRTDRRLIAEARANVPSQIVEIKVPFAGPDVAAVDENDGPEIPPDIRAKLGGKIHEREPAYPKARSAQRRHFVAPPATEVRRTTEKIPLEERDLDFRITDGINRSEARLAREHQSF